MKLIVAIIRPDRLNEVLEALYRAASTRTWVEINADMTMKNG